jgi:1-deoxy-D-xylulose-5-phosphate synthase
MFLTAFSHNGPCAIRYPRGVATGVKVDTDCRPLSIGQGEILTQGDDLLILAIGRSVCEALSAQKTLQEQGVSSTVVNCRFVKPIGVDLIGSLAQKIPRIITVEENVRQGGFGSAVLESLFDEGVVGISLQRIGIADTFVEHGPQDLLRTKYGIDASAIVDTALRMMKNAAANQAQILNAQSF